MSGENDATKNILVDLDSLLDTRLGTIEKMNPEAANLLFCGKAYYEREIDDWETLTGGLISNEAFKAEYAKRDKHTLELSRPTNILTMLHKITRELDMARITAPDIEHIKVSVNCYPYEFTESERKAIATLVFSYCSLGTDVTTTSLSLADITPTLMQSDYDGVILYDFDGWFTHHCTELNTVLIPRNAMFAPALYVKDPKEMFDEMPEELKGVSPFSMMEIAFVERLSLELLRAKEFSIKPLAA